MSTKTKSLTKVQQRAALKAAAAWLGPRMGYEGPAPTGQEAAHKGLGPYLNPAWDWPSSGPTATILLEGGPLDWACEIWQDEEFDAIMRQHGILAEPYSGYALCLYRE